jgi:hypothetical protein
MTAAASAGNSRWEVIAAACGVLTYEDIPGIIRQPPEIIPGTVATLRGDRSAAVCHDCYTDLHPAITVAVRFLSAASQWRRAVRRDPPAYPQRGHSPSG